MAEMSRRGPLPEPRPGAEERQQRRRPERGTPAAGPGAGRPENPPGTEPGAGTGQPAGVPNWRRALRPALRNRLVLFGIGIVAGLVLLAALAGTVAPYDPTEMKVADALKGPSAAHPFGTDRFGRDVLSRTIHGSRIALGVAVSSIAIAFVAGTALGLVGGYVGGWPDLAIGRLMDVLFSFPTLILAIAIAAMP